LSCTYNGVGNWTTYQSEPFTISQSTDRKSYKPSLVQKINWHISVSWIRDRTGDGGSPYYINAVNWDSENGSVYRIYGAWDVRPIKKQNCLKIFLDFTPPPAYILYQKRKACENMKSLKDMMEKDKDDQQKSPVAQFIPQKAGLFPTSAGLLAEPILREI